MSEVRVGCSSWTSPAWKGRFYPPELPDGDRLAYYARYFDVVEVDATYYRAPSPYVVRGWARKTPEGFRFAVKFPRDLLDPKAPEAETAVAPFVESVQLLGAKLGPVLLQFPPWFKGPRSPGTGFADFLERRVRSLPSGPSYAVELREAGWFAPENRRWL
ncbi:MAG TPA: DUF72 domain-containing protein, partial [Thermoplasmata archaeon]|nr:DUF72 domain-containing protein [Thermoplasmata archaeon]